MPFSSSCADTHTHGPTHQFATDLHPAGIDRVHHNYCDQMNMDIGPDEDDDFTDIREQIFHNTVREQIVSRLFQFKKYALYLNLTLKKKRERRE